MSEIEEGPACGSFFFDRETIIPKVHGIASKSMATSGERKVPELLEYGRARGRSKSELFLWCSVGAGLGMLLAWIALGIVRMTASEPLNYLPTKLFFPYAVLAIRAARHETVASEIATLAPLPLYGGLCGAAVAARGWWLRMLPMAAVLHAVAAAVCIAT